MTRWEYMLIYWTYSTWSDGKTRQWKKEFFISRPDGEEETRVAWLHDGSEGKTSTTISRLLNEFGAEGWELISENALENEVFEENYGWKMAGGPIGMRWTLKRPLVEGNS
jgi:hypothetical protein